MIVGQDLRVARRIIARIAGSARDVIDKGALESASAQHTSVGDDQRQRGGWRGTRRTVAARNRGSSNERQGNRRKTRVEWSDY